MATALNFTVPLKQDPQSQESLGHLVTSFAQEVQPAIDAALARSQIVHFARIVVIDNQYLQSSPVPPRRPLLAGELDRIARQADAGGLGHALGVRPPAAGRARDRPVAGDARGVHGPRASECRHGADPARCPGQPGHVPGAGAAGEGRHHPRRPLRRDAVREFATEAADEAFGDRVGTRRLHRCLDGDDLAGYDGVRS